QYADLKEGLDNHTEKTIINIQDAHSNFGAQKSIVGVLDTLSQKYDVDLIGIEGSKGYIDTALVSAFPDNQAKERTADILMRKGIISSGEYFSMTTDKPVAVYGVENTELYVENVQQFRSLVKHRTENMKNIEDLINALKVLMPKMFSKELVVLNENGVLQKEGQITFTEHWQYIYDLGNKEDLSCEDHTNLNKLLQVQKQEKEINFKAAEKQRKILIDVLGNLMNKQDLEELVLQSLNFKMGKVSAVDFHEGLISYARQYNIEPKDFEELIKYSEYLRAYDDIDILNIFAEIERYENSIKQKLYVSEDQKQLDKLFQDALLMKELFDAKLSAVTYRQLSMMLRNIKKEDFIFFIKDNYKKYNLQLPEDLDIASVFDAIPDAIAFYKIAEERNEAIFNNMINLMDKNGDNVAAVITGGFHTEGITEIFKEQDLSYLVVVPKFKEDDPERPYIAILTSKDGPYLGDMRTGDYIAVYSCFDTSREILDELGINTVPVEQMALDLLFDNADIDLIKEDYLANLRSIYDVLKDNGVVTEQEAEQNIKQAQEYIEAKEAQKAAIELAQAAKKAERINIAVDYDPILIVQERIQALIEISKNEEELTLEDPSFFDGIVGYLKRTKNYELSTEEEILNDLLEQVKKVLARQGYRTNGLTVEDINLTFGQKEDIISMFTVLQKAPVADKINENIPPEEPIEAPKPEEPTWETGKPLSPEQEYFQRTGDCFTQIMAFISNIKRISSETSEALEQIDNDITENVQETFQNSPASLVEEYLAIYKDSKYKNIDFATLKYEDKADIIAQVITSLIGRMTLIQGSVQEKRDMSKDIEKFKVLLRRFLVINILFEHSSDPLLNEIVNSKIKESVETEQGYKDAIVSVDKAIGKAIESKEPLPGLQVIDNIKEIVSNMELEQLLQEYQNVLDGYRQGDYSKKTLAELSAREKRDVLANMGSSVISALEPEFSLEDINEMDLPSAIKSYFVLLSVFSMSPNIADPVLEQIRADRQKPEIEKEEERGPPAIGGLGGTILGVMFLSSIIDGIIKLFTGATAASSGVALAGFGSTNFFPVCFTLLAISGLSYLLVGKFKVKRSLITAGILMVLFGIGSVFMLKPSNLGDVVKSVFTANEFVERQITAKELAPNEVSILNGVSFSSRTSYSGQKMDTLTWNSSSLEQKLVFCEDVEKFVQELKKSGKTPIAVTTLGSFAYKDGEYRMLAVTGPMAFNGGYEGVLKTKSKVAGAIVYKDRAGWHIVKSSQENLNMIEASKVELYFSTGPYFKRSGALQSEDYFKSDISSHVYMGVDSAGNVKMLRIGEYLAGIDQEDSRKIVIEEFKDYDDVVACDAGRSDPTDLQCFLEDGNIVDAKTWDGGYPKAAVMVLYVDKGKINTKVVEQIKKNMDMPILPITLLSGLLLGALVIRRKAIANLAKEITRAIAQKPERPEQGEIEESLEESKAREDLKAQLDAITQLPAQDQDVSMIVAISGKYGMLSKYVRSKVMEELSKYFYVVQGTVTTLDEQEIIDLLSAWVVDSVYKLDDMTQSQAKRLQKFISECETLADVEEVIEEVVPANRPDWKFLIKCFIRFHSEVQMPILLINNQEGYPEDKEESLMMFRGKLIDEYQQGQYKG
ncbi:MAG: DUF4064 domain-containing protein, partial [Candidatus Omnitrophica bacterium]|nr:DUF4064 domain-containing protein [Candidatus Omnitrophota bacterium]